MDELDAALERARLLDVEALAASIRRIGFECTRCGACCRADDETGDPHTATLFPDEVREIQDRTDGEWRDIARPVPYGFESDGTGETFEWALQVDHCGDCRFLKNAEGRQTRCGVYDVRPRVCRTYPFQVAIPGVHEPQATTVESDGLIDAYECEGLGRAIDEADADRMARALKRRAIVEIQEAMGTLDGYRRTSTAATTVVYDSEGPKRPDGEPIDVGR